MNHSIPLKTLILVLTFGTFTVVKGQSFRTEAEVQQYMEGKTYYNSELKIRLQYGYISSYNTYGIKSVNQYGDKYFFVNVNVSPYGSFADLFGISTTDGSRFGFRLYGNKLVVGRGESTEYVFYLE